jgi:hypothetical protein
LTTIPELVLPLITSKSKEMKKKINEEILKKDNRKIKELYDENEKKMRKNYIFHYVIFVALSTFSLYYSIIFCIVYRGSSSNWFADGFIGIMISLIVKLILLILLTVLRVGVRKYQDK